MNINKKDILFPVFVSLFINDDGKSCIYYFRGLTEDYKWVYQEFNENEMPPHKKIVNPDGSLIYLFDIDINTIKCHLISNYPEIKDKIFLLNNKYYF